jgi:LPS sulfotransferase NodH
MKWSDNGIVFNLKNNRGRITSPLAHFIVSPLKRQFIASYPRSGSTWLRTMLTNVIDPSANSNPDIFNRMIPGTTLTRLWLAYRAPDPHILSTHSVYRRGIKRVVYVLRDGRDSMLSLYRYTTVRIGIRMGFNQWFSFYMKGWYGPRWDQHVESWLTRGCERLGRDMLIVRYEDCCADPHGELKKVCDFFGIEFALADIERAVKLSSVDNMKKWERKLLGEIKSDNASFYRGKKQADEWLSLLNDEQRNKFMRISKNAMRLGGYYYE